MEVIKGSDLKLLLKKKGITQVYLEKELDVPQSLISRYLSDDVVPTYPFIIKLAALAGLSIDDLVVKGKADVKIMASEPQASYQRTEKPETITIDNLGIIIREMQNKIQDLQKDLKVLKEKEKQKEFA